MHDKPKQKIKHPFDIWPPPKSEKADNELDKIKKPRNLSYRKPDNISSESDMAVYEGEIEDTSIKQNGKDQEKEDESK